MAYPLAKCGVEAPASHGSAHKTRHGSRKSYPGAILHNRTVDVVYGTVVKKYGGYPVGYIIRGNSKLLAEKTFERTTHNSRNRYTTLKNREEDIQLVNSQS
jgi:hypothetical protein